MPTSSAQRWTPKTAPGSMRKTWWARGDGPVVIDEGRPSDGSSRSTRGCSEATDGGERTPRAVLCRRRGAPARQCARIPSSHEGRATPRRGRGKGARRSIRGSVTAEVNAAHPPHRAAAAAERLRYFGREGAIGSGWSRLRPVLEHRAARWASFAERGGLAPTRGIPNRSMKARNKVSRPLPHAGGACAFDSAGPRHSAASLTGVTQTRRRRRTGTQFYARARRSKNGPFE